MKPTLCLLVAAVVLSGCASTPALDAPSPDATQPTTDLSPTTTAPAPMQHSAASTAPHPAAPDEVRLHGNVLSPSLQPLANATVAVVGLDRPQVTGDDGAFDFGRLPRHLYTLQAQAPGYLESNLTVTPQDAEQALKVVLQPGYPVTPYNTTLHFQGVLQCAFEALIISPSCDSGLVAVGGPALFEQNQSFLFGADLGWKTLVLDVVFDGGAHPGLEGLRIALRGSLDPDGGGEYVQYGRWHDAHSFTARVEPGGNYTDGVEAVPLNATGFQLDVYPHGHAYHQVCGGDSCFLGAGAAVNVSFDVYATLFYVDPAPAGWTMRSP